jgi:hypothetical protein
MEKYKKRLLIVLILSGIYFLISSYLSELNYYETILFKIFQALGSIYFSWNIINYMKNRKNHNA